ncbi:hypothetical protein Poli38472_002354 [Pythium oligandrum]|uniref:MYB transcription factor n=1 Tax=Pythium oligandrum TaxID=41045 RepID=A0A8K1CJ59_PYTOL|nr:hypothetical protein Poli38472_002354 [Pythium oligandrum]|eukprot:TMW63413.1 hypothetical protein Poli38472_002354 [Pythium oligandrum]
MTSRSRRASEVRRQSTSRGPSPTPPASGSRRQSTGTPTRLSLGSSSGRRSNRHSGSLQEVSELLTRTRESLLRASLATTETMSQYEEHTPSRQLSFGSARRDDEGKEEEGEDVTSFAALLEEQDRLRETESRSHTDNEDADYGGDTVEEEEEEENDAEADAGKGTTRRSRPGRLRWTKKEEEALTKGVEAFGVGKWRKILASGMGIFNSRRTNVDLKDKWRGLSKRIDQQRASGDRTPPRPRRRSSIQSPSPAPKRQRQGERSAAAMAKSAMLAVRTHEESQTDYSAELSTQPTQQSDSVVDDSQDLADGQSAVPPTEDEEEDAEEETVELKIGTDDTFPSLLDVTVTTAVGATVSVLKRELANQLLEKTAKPSTVQLVAIRTRRLLGDSERVDACLESDGTVLYLLKDN